MYLYLTYMIPFMRTRSLVTRLQYACHEFGVTLCINQLAGKSCKSLDIYFGGTKCES